MAGPAGRMMAAGGDSEQGAVQYVCEVCAVHATSHQDLQSHLRGRSHMEMVQRSEVTRRSVYLRGFPATPTIETELRELLSQFGGVVSVMVKASSEDTFGLVEFSCEEAALRALRHPSPLTLHTHTLTLKPRLLNPGKPAKRRVRLGRKQRVDIASVSPNLDSSLSSSKEEEVGMGVSGEGCGEEVIGGIRLTAEAMIAISAAHSANAQMEALALHCRHSNVTAENQLALASRLQSKLRPLIPSCMVVPFGAPFSGHGTVSSDCDLCVLTAPSSQDTALFSGPAYLSPQLLALWQQLQTTPTAVETTPPVGISTYHVDVLDLSFQRVLVAVQGDQQCSHVLAIPHARCPVIRFQYQPLRLHCDLSINNRLGPANTRLLAAYMNFDPRMATLVPCVRLWARGWGIRRSQLNSYALSLMLIHCLQHTSPPVLPCLQDPGVWPKNMAWIGGQGFSASPQHLELDGWDCSFTDPHSLLPSSNTASSAELLLHFLHYYSECFPFSEQAVAVHTLAPPLISLLHETHPPPGPNSASRGAGFRVSSLCVQDPFERSHNVTKSIKSQSAQLLQALRSSREVLRRVLEGESPNMRQDLLPVFRQSEVASPGKRPTASHTLHLSADTVHRLLQGTQYAVLADRLQELDLRNPHVHCTLDRLVLQALAQQLEGEFGLSVQTERQPETASSSLPPSSPLLPSAEDGGCMEADSPSQQHKRRRPREEEEEGMEVEKGWEGGKKLRLAGQESAEQLLFRLAEGLGAVLVCSAVEESWQHRRRRRRKGEQREATSCSPESSVGRTVGGLAASLPALPPCLIFTLTLPRNLSPSNHLTAVTMCASHAMFCQSFQQFFAVCKKWLLSSHPH